MMTQTYVFQIRVLLPTFLTINYLLDNFSENVDVSEIINNILNTIEQLTLIINSRSCWTEKNMVANKLAPLPYTPK